MYVANHVYIQVEEILHHIDLDSPSVCVTRLINILFNTLELYESMGILSQHVTKVRFLFSNIAFLNFIVGQILIFFLRIKVQLARTILEIPSAS